jgi:7-cyano-7-deazaguanine synthase
MKKLAIAVVSGGLDSMGYATIWKSRGYEIQPINFKYGQKGVKESEIVLELSPKLGFLKPVICDFSDLKEIWRGTQLTDESVEVTEGYHPLNVVPLRNAVFLTVATAFAFNIGAEYVLIGSQFDKFDNEVGEFHYPDSTPEFLITLEVALNLGHFRSKRGVKLYSPVREGLRKPQVVKMFYDLAGDLVFETWSCLARSDIQCGSCICCTDRKNVFKELGIEDKTRYLK